MEDTATGNFDDTKATEKAYHESMYSRDSLRPVTVDGVQELLTPCYEGPSDHYSENRGAFHDLIRRDGGWVGKRVLDYACGFGTYAVYYSLTGAKESHGFDIAEAAIERARQRANDQGLEDKVDFRAQDASSLDYDDDYFDIVIGHGVIHHVIKYENIFEELHRILKPGAKAYFLEGLADFPVWSLYWKLRGEFPQGDVPIFTKEVQEKAQMFSNVEVIGDTFFHSLKRVVWKQHPSALRRAALRMTHATDKAMFKMLPFTRNWGSFSYIVLTK